MNGENKVGWKRMDEETTLTWKVGKWNDGQIQGTRKYQRAKEGFETKVRKR